MIDILEESIRLTNLPLKEIIEENTDNIDSSKEIQEILFSYNSLRELTTKYMNDIQQQLKDEDRFAQIDPKKTWGLFFVTYPDGDLLTQHDKFSLNGQTN